MSVTKKLLNDVDKCVDDNLEGLVAVNSGLRLVPKHRTVIREDYEKVKTSGKVTLLCGGGSGHEPAHAGYVGCGMLTAVVAGSVFASPPPSNILAALQLISKGSEAGVLIIVKNYTGDRINFGLATEKCRAAGVKVEVVTVGEDCALESHDHTAGRRGLAGTIFVQKIAGALAEEGKDLNHVTQSAERAAQNMGTIGLSLSPCSVPGRGPTFTLANDEMELGLGVHGEAGVKRMKVLTSKESVKVMLDHMTNTQNSTHLKLKSGDKVALMVNNLGGTSWLEMNIVCRDAIAELESRGVCVERAYCAPFITSLEMAGISLTLLHLDDEFRRCLDAPTAAPGWPRPLLPQGQTERVTPEPIILNEEPESQDQNVFEHAKTVDGDWLAPVLKTVCEALIGAELELNELDAQAGDGDCGTTLRNGAQDLLRYLATLSIRCPARLFYELALRVAHEMGGTSGGLYSLFFTAASRMLNDDTSGRAFVQSLEAGVAAIVKYGRASVGDRTMLDALCAALDVLREKEPSMDLLLAAVEAAERAAESTAKMTARAGRASYVAADQLTSPDAGAKAAAIILRAVYSALC